MSPQLAADLMTVLPELTMALGGMALLMIGVFFGERRPALMTVLTILLLGAAVYLVLQQPSAGVLSAFNGHYTANALTRFAKVLALGGAALSLILAHRYFVRAGIARFEFPVLVVFAALGMMLMISAGGLIALYAGLELQSLALYVLAAFHRDNAKATEAGLKYFVLGALSSCMLLYGASLLYGYTGAVTFQGIAAALEGERNLGALTGIVFLLAGFAFKISAVPFHMWTPDVYEGAPTPVTAFFASAPKVAAMALLIRVLYEALPGAIADWRQIITFIAIASMVLGAFGAIGQTNIKRLMGYSSIGNMGYVLVGVAAGSPAGVQGALIFLAIYAVMTIGTFVCILAMRRADGPAEQINDLSGLMQTQPLLAVCMILLMFSYVGIPPLPGFFGKFYVFVAAVDAGLWPLAIIGVLASVVAAFYYVRIVMIMINGKPGAPFLRDMGGELRIVLGLLRAFAVAMTLVPGLIAGWAGTASLGLAP